MRVPPDTSIVQSYDLTKGLEHMNNVWSADDNSSLSTNASQKEHNYSLITKMIAEFLGAFTFVFVGTMQAVVMTGSEKQSPVVDGIVHAALAHGLTIFVLVTTLGHISGGHFNPVVSWAVAASGKMPFYHLPFYCFAQLLGGFCGSLYSVLILTQKQLDASHAGVTMLSPNNTWWEGMMSEAVATFFLCHTILLTAIDTNANLMAPLAIGLTVTIDVLSTGSITGASMNPARSLGPNIVGQIFLDSDLIPEHFWNYHHIYYTGPFIGATISVVIYRLFEARKGRLLL